MSRTTTPEGVADLVHDGAHLTPVDNVDLVVGLVVHANGGVARSVVENKFEVVCLRGAGAEIDGGPGCRLR